MPSRWRQFVLERRKKNNRKVSREKTIFGIKYYKEPVGNIGKHLIKKMKEENNIKNVISRGNDD